MEPVTRLSEFFLLSLSIGVGGFSFLADPRQTGGGFFKLLGGICGGALILATLLNGIDWAHALALLPPVGIYLLHRDERTLGMGGLFALHLLFSLILLWRTLPPPPTPADLFFALSSVAFMGSVTFSMLLGHWYLVTPKLSERPLKRTLFFTWPLLALKLLLSGSSYKKMGALWATEGGMDPLFHGILLAMRWGWGYFVVGIMSYFAYRLVSMRSLQSATGIFYAMTFFVFAGELISLYLFRQYGLYL